MSPAFPPHPAGDAALLRRAGRLAAEARLCTDLSAPNAMLAALSLRQQLAGTIKELAAGCATMAGQMAAFQLRQTATMAYGARDANGRTRN